MQNETQSKEREAEKEARVNPNRHSLDGFPVLPIMLGAIAAGGLLYVMSDTQKEGKKVGADCRRLEREFDTDGNGKLDSKESERMARAVGYEGVWQKGTVAKMEPRTYFDCAVLEIYEKGEATSPRYLTEHRVPISKLKDLVRKTQNRK
jgi:hypothetical protein